MLDGGLSQLVDWRAGIVSNEIFSDEELYRLEQERVFARSWLFVGHESMVPRPGDYITNYMGEDSVIVCKDLSGKIRVFINKCPHRGNKVCLFDRGKTAAFTCSYHGWSFNTEGRLVGVPEYEKAYHGELNKDEWGLIEIPRVESYGGIIFACADPEAMPLEEHLGELKWYLDNFITVEYLGGLEVVPGLQRYLASGNWKLLTENFHGDHYHFASTHASVVKVRQEFAQKGLSTTRYGRPVSFPRGERFEVTIGFEKGVPHGLGGLVSAESGERYYQSDLAAAAELGPEAVEWVKERYRRLGERLKQRPVRPYSFMRGNIFPNFSLMAFASGLWARTFILWHPRGPHMSEVWEWCLVERDAPRIVKEFGIQDLVHGQSAGGIIAPDDRENFERMAENLKTPLAKRRPFNYAIEAGHERDWAQRHEDEIAGLPGLIGPDVTENNHRQLYRYWAELMSKE